MGFFDSLLSDDPKQQALNAMAFGLLGGNGKTRRNFGADVENAGLLGMNTFSAAQKAERENRANDLQQITGLYGVLRQRDLMQHIADDQAGRPHIEDPAMKAMEAKMAALSGVKSLAAPGASLPDQAPAPQQPQLPQVAPQQSAPPPGPQMSTPQNPQFNVPPAQGLLAPQGAPLPAADPAAALRNSAELYAAMAGKPELIAENRFKRSLPTFSRGVAFDSGTGGIMGGMVDNVPVQNNNGRIQVIPNDIAPAIAERAGQVAAATSTAKAPYEFKDVPGANRMISIAAARAAEGPVPGAPQTLPAWLQPNPNAAQAAVAPRVAQLTVTQPSKNAPGSQGGGIYGPDPVTQAGDIAQQKAINDTYGKAFEEIRQKGVEAPYQSAMLKEMLALTQGALNGQTGAFAPMRQKWTEYLTSAGVPQKVIDALPQTISNLPEAQEFVKLATQRAMSQTRTMGAREAASVFNQVQAANPNMALTSSAMEKIIQPLMAEQDWNFQKHQAADQWLASHNGKLAGFESTWNKEQPFEKFWKGATYAQPRQTPGGWSIRKISQ